MTERRYDDDEVRQIFSLATTNAAGPSHRANASGLTLDELQRIGEEAGIDRAWVAAAAASLDAKGRPAPVRRSFGLPVGLTRVVELPRAITDREWEQLITEFRTALGGQGAATTNGNFREWAHGSLTISIEPTARGEQMRLTMHNEGARALNGLSLILGVMASIIAAVIAASGNSEKALIVLGIFGGMSLAALGFNWIWAPRWARTCAGHMESLTEHAVRLLSKP